jgi:hypothetical protein
VVARVSVSGTHRGEMLGLAPTGKRIRTSGIEVFRIEDGKMGEHWATFDVLGMLRQIGVVPVPEPALPVRTPGTIPQEKLPASEVTGGYFKIATMPVRDASYAARRVGPRAEPGCRVAAPAR